MLKIFNLIITMKIEYFYGIPSPFAYLGSAKLQSIAEKYNAEIIEKPCDLVGGIFTKTGGLPVPLRSPQRQKYRLDELKRWSEFLNIKINLKPKFFPPKDPHLSSKYTIAANLLGVKIVFGHELLKNIWSEEKDISDEKNIETVSNTEEAVIKNVFGAPTYIYNDELFWGQDRLDFLERALNKS